MTSPPSEPAMVLRRSEETEETLRMYSEDRRRDRCGGLQEESVFAKVRATIGATEPS